MATKYEVLASLVKRDADHYIYMNNGSDDGNWEVLIGILRILHNYETGPRFGGPNRPIDYEQAAEDVYDLIAEAFAVETFDGPASEPSNRDVLDAIEDTIEVARNVGSDMPPELDIPDRH